jgi:formyl-CoA transferase
MSNEPERRPDQTEGPLSDLRVLELGTLIAGPFAGRLLADFGAQVIKVERPGSGDPLRRWGRAVDDGESLWHLVQQRGKRSIVADLHDPADQALVRRLALESDILIENFRPGRLEAWGLAPDELMASNPRLIVVRISGYGQTGPLSDQPGFGTIAEAAGGLRYLTGQPDATPTRVGLSLGDSIASLHALYGALVALHERERSGRGQVVDVALSEALFSMLEAILPEYGYFGVVRERTGNIAHNSAPTNVYACADGAEVCIAANTTGLARDLFAAIGREDLAADPELATDRGRVVRAAELDRAISAWTGALPAGEVLARLRALRIPVSRINSIADIVADPQFRAREMVVSVEDPRLARPLLVPGITPRLSRTPGRIRGLAPPLGADTEAVRAEVGASAAEASTPEPVAPGGSGPVGHGRRP